MITAASRDWLRWGTARVGCGVLIGVVGLGAGCNDPLFSTKADGGTDGRLEAAPALAPGQVLVSQGGSQSIIGGHFTSSTQCTEKSIGPCVLVECGGAPDALASAGTLGFAGGLIPPGTQLVPRPSDNTYFTQFLNGPLFAPGDSITVSASGAALPAFSRKVIAPEKVALTAPDCTHLGSPTCGKFDQTQDLPVAWTGGSGTVDVMLSVSGGTIGSATMHCRLPAADGHGVIPVAALAALPRPDDLMVIGQVAVSSATIDTFMEGSMPSEIQLHQIAVEGHFIF